LKIRIKNLRLRTIVGIEDWEQNHLQDVIVNIELEFDGRQAVKTDAIEQTVNYKALKMKILKIVENSRFNLLETMADHLLNLIMEDTRVNAASVEVDKPHALRFADSVSVMVSGSRET
jgi:D-erythro-7,8-dihydroneopterin triphosphate epimerase